MKKNPTFLELPIKFHNKPKSNQHKNQENQENSRFSSFLQTHVNITNIHTHRCITSTVEGLIYLLINLSASIKNDIDNIDTSVCKYKKRKLKLKRRGIKKHTICRASPKLNLLEELKWVELNWVVQYSEDI